MLCFIWLFITAGGLCQTKYVDSLRLQIARASSPVNKIQAIRELAGQPVNPDTLFLYVVLGESIAAKTNDRYMIDQMGLVRANYYVRRNFIDSALNIVDPLIQEYKKSKEHSSFYLTLLFLRGKAYDRNNRYTQSLTQLYEVVEVAESQKDTATAIQAKTGIGWVQMEMEQYTEALAWFYKAMNTSGNQKFYKNYGALYSNIASSYNALHKPDSAQHYIDIAIQNARESDNLLFLATALSMQAKIFTDNGMQQLAEKPLSEVVDIRKKLNDDFYTVFDMSSLASYYAHNNQPQKGIELCREGIVIATSRGLSSQLLMIYHALAENYKAAGNITEYSRTLGLIIQLKDSFNNINSSKLLADMQANSDAQKKQKEILEQKLILTQKNYWLYGSAIFGLMLVVIASLAFKQYRRREALKMELALLEEKRNAADAVKKAEEKERVRIAADLHDNLGAYAASMASNLNYIRVDAIDEQTNNAFGELRNNSNAIISQLHDTIWVLKKEALSLTAISDRIKTFIGRIRNSYPGIRIDVEEKIEPDHLLASSQAFQLYRLLQEAITNALKHSKGRNIVIHITGNHTWNVSVADDGAGFTPGDLPAERGSGLSNMKKRCTEAGWNIRWDKLEPGGTMVSIAPTTN